MATIKPKKYEIVYTLVKPLAAYIEADNKEEALRMFEEKMSNNPTLTIHADLCGKIDVKVKKTTKL